MGVLQQTKATGSICCVMLVTRCCPAADTLGILARTIGEEHFRPLAQECILLGMVSQPSETGGCDTARKPAQADMLHDQPCPQALSGLTTGPLLAGEGLGGQGYHMV